MNPEYSRIILLLQSGLNPIVRIESKSECCPLDVGCIARVKSFLIESTRTRERENGALFLFDLDASEFDAHNGLKAIHRPDYEAIKRSGESVWNRYISNMVYSSDTEKTGLSLFELPELQERYLDNPNGLMYTQWLEERLRENE